MYLYIHVHISAEWARLSNTSHDTFRTYVYVCVHAYTYIHKYIHTYIHTYMHTP